MSFRPLFYLCRASAIMLILILSCSGNNTRGKEESVYLEVARDTNVIDIKKYKLLISPLHYIRDTNGSSREAETGTVKNIIFNSFYTFLSILPPIDVPEKDELENLSVERPDETASESKADFIVYGDYSLAGKISPPQANITLKIWSGITKSLITSQFQLQTDEDIFEGIDSIISYTVKTILKEDRKIAFLNFGNFSIEPDNYELYVNNRLVARPKDSNFSLSLKILSKTKYHVLMIRDSDEVKVINGSVILEAGETTNISFITNRKLIIAFENNMSKPLDLHTYTSWSSSVSTNYSSSVAGLSSLNKKIGRNALIISVISGQNGFCTVSMNLSREQGDWKEFNALSLWVAGSLGRKWFNIKILDANNENWVYIVDDTWQGWKQITIPFEKLRRRRDDQPKNAILNGILTFPIKRLVIFNFDPVRGGRCGTYDICFSKIEVYK